MISAREVIDGLYGAWRLARLDAGGMRWLNISIEGFWRSFFAVILAAPGYAVLVLLSLDPEILSARPLRVFLVEGGAYLLGWGALPVLAIFLVHLLALSDRYVAFIIAYNWASVLQTALFLLVMVLAATGAVPRGLGAILIFAATAAILFYQWFVARTALKTTALTAVGFVAVDLVAGFLIEVGASALL